MSLHFKEKHLRIETEIVSQAPDKVAGVKSIGENRADKSSAPCRDCALSWPCSYVNSGNDANNRQCYCSAISMLACVLAK